MLAKEDDFPTTTCHDATPSIPIIALPTQATSQAPQSLPRISADLPPRCRNEPAVLGCATGEVRRMRSVLDMKLGAMAVSLETHLATSADLFCDTPTENAHEQHPKNNVNSIITPSRCGEMFDVFGIAIPKSTQAKMQREGLAEPVYGKSSECSDPISSLKSDGACSLFLAESPSRLDLSALLC